MKANSFLLTGLFMLIACSLATAQTVKESKKVSKFTSIEVSNGIDAKFTQRKSHTLAIEGKKDDVKKVDWLVENGVLKIKCKPNQSFSKNNKLVAYITASDLANIQASSGSDFSADNITSKSDLNIAASGGSDIDIKTITAATINISLSGGSDCNIDHLKAKTTQISSSGGSDLEIHFGDSGDVNVAASGGSDMELSGKVKSINLDCSGGSDANIKKLTYSKIDVKNDVSSDISR